MDEFMRGARALKASMPRTPGVDISMALTVSLLRVLEERDPGLREAVRQRVLRSARAMEASDDPRMVEDAPSMYNLAESWIFTE